MTMVFCTIILTSFLLLLVNTNDSIISLNSFLTKACHPDIAGDVDPDPVVPGLSGEVMIPDEHHLHPPLPLLCLISVGIQIQLYVKYRQITSLHPPLPLLCLIYVRIQIQPYVKHREIASLHLPPSTRLSGICGNTDSHILNTDR